MTAPTNQQGKLTKTSAGLLVFRRRGERLEVLLVHPGGPFFRKKDLGVWSIPKGEIAPGEDMLQAAKREFYEEIGVPPPDGPFLKLSPVKQKGGKTVYAWAIEGDCDTSQVNSNTFTMEWPPGSGQLREFPEVDRAEFVDLESARKKINPAQVPLLDELETLVAK